MPCNAGLKRTLGSALIVTAVSCCCCGAYVSLDYSLDGECGFQLMASIGRRKKVPLYWLIR